MTTVAVLRSELCAQFYGLSTTPQLDAEVLLMTAIHQSRSFLIAYPDYELTANELTLIRHYQQRRLNGEPIAYITSQKEFWSLTLTVSPAVLIPRPESEHLIEWLCQSRSEELVLTAADLGTGSGALALALASERPHWHIDATDSSFAALQVAISNARQQGLSNVAFYYGSWCEALPHARYHIIMSNPPYLAHDDPHLSALSYEPRQALSADAQGLAAIKRIILDARRHLLPGGVLIIEHGHEQGDMTLELLTVAGYINICDHCDLAGLPRFATGEIKS